MSDFVHLHNHSHYSLLDGACKIDDLVETCVQFKMPAFALTDHGNMFGAIEFYQKALEAGIKPIIGVETYIAPTSRFDRTSSKGGSDASYHVVLLAKDYTGYKNLMKLVSIGYQEGFYYKPRIDKEVLQKHREGLIALTACLKGEVQQRLLSGGYDEAKKAALQYREIFGEDFYLEVQNHNLADEDAVREALMQLSSDLAIKVVATNDIHYLKKEHFLAHDVLLCLQTQSDYDDPQRLRYNTDQIYFKSSEEMHTLFADFPEALANTLEVAEKCNLLIDFKSTHLPRFTLPPEEESRTLDAYLEKLAKQGLKQRYPQVTPQLEERLRYELGIIKRMGYAGYFLIVKDFIDYARRQGIPVGPGRGSAAGSLVSYVLGITNIDPLRYGLIFERFLNPERISLPDIDIDFCYERREEIINYVKGKYGENNVTQIITFGTMAARAVIRDVGRVLKMAYSEVDRIAKLIPATVGITLDEALRTVPDLAQAAESSDLHKKLIEYSRILEGLARHASTHAAGVVITPEELTNYTPLYKPPQGEVTTQYDMKSLADIGLLKMDFLGLRTLTVIDNTVKALAKRGIKIEIDSLPLDDPDTYKLFANGDTVGIFQFESTGMRDYLRKLKPQCLEDLIAMNALYRPGPMAMIDEFIQCRHGLKKIEYLHPLLEPVLKETYGVIVYQEQVIRIASDLGGFSLASADVLRRAMGKKEPELMREQRERFLQGAEKKKISRNLAEELFNLIIQFAGYGFNKSHAAGYSLIAYHTAYLKTHFPAEFMAATLSSEMGNTNRIVTLIDECRRMGLEVLPPDVNESFADFVVVDNRIRFGLGAVKNVGVAAIESIVAAREKNGRFRTIFDLTENVDLRLVNKKVLESLAQAGAMDSLEGHRAQLLAAVDTAIGYGQHTQTHRARGQTSIFDLGGKESAEQPKLPEVKKWSKSETLTKEKSLLGFYVSGHPLFKYEEEVRAFSTVSLDALNSVRDGAPVRVCGIVTEIKSHFDRKNKPMAFFTIEDFLGAAEALIFSDAYAKYRQFLHSDAMVMLIGKTSTREEENTKILCEEVVPLAETRERFTKGICISLDVKDVQAPTISQIGQILQVNVGKCPLYLTVLTPENGEYLLRSERFRVNPTLELMTQLREVLGKENVWVEG